MTPDESREQVVAFVMDSTAQLGMSGWWPRNGIAGPDVCSMGGGVEGAEYSYDLYTDKGDDPIAAAEKVAGYWESLGMVVSTTNATTFPTVYGSGGPVLRASFDTAANDQAVGDSYRVGAVMPCVPGDWFELAEQDDADRAKGKVFPGDEGIVLHEDPRDKWRTLMPTPEGR